MRKRLVPLGLIVAIVQIIVVNTGSDKASRWVSAEKLAEKK
jgi:hypothetical protein